jgi:hypothetical protein
VGIATNVSRRKGSSKYYVRTAIPVDLVDAFNGRKEIWRSLRTADGKEAKRLARPILDEWDREFTRIRNRRTMSEHDIQEAVWQRYGELTDADDAFRRSLPTSEDLDAIWTELEREFGEYDLQAFRVFEFIRNRFEINQKERVQRNAAMKHDAARGETRLVADDARRVAHARGVELQKSSTDFRRLAQGLQRAELEALIRAEERDQGNWAGEPRDKLIRPPVAGIFATPGETIMDLFATYAAENPDNVKQNTIDQSRMSVQLFVDLVGERYPLAKLDKKALRAWKALLLRYPVKAAETADFRGLSLREIVKANEKIGKPAISARTVNRYLSSLGAFCDWLVHHDWISTNPTRDMSIRLDRTKRAILPFSSD